MLLVDDEPSVLSSLERVLRPKRYRVLTADSGDAALYARWPSTRSI